MSSLVSLSTCLTITLLSLAPLFPSPSAAADAPHVRLPADASEAEAEASSGPAAAALHDLLAKFDRQLQDQLRRAALAARDGLPAEEGLRARAESLDDRLDLLAAEARRLGDPVVAGELSRKIRGLRPLIGNLRRAALTEPHPSMHPQVGRPALAPAVRGRPPAGTVSNDLCANAQTVGLGTVIGTTLVADNDGSATCGSSLFSPDVWFRFVAPSAGYYSFDTFGASFDTVLSLHTSCPGTVSNQLTCNDDTFGLQSATGRTMYATQEVLIRISGFGGDAGGYVLNVGRGGEIVGQVTAADIGLPLDDGSIEAYDDRGYYVGRTDPDVDGAYSFSGLAIERYFLVAEYFDGYLDEVYDGVHCPGLLSSYCDPDSGTPIEVTSDVTAVADFTLDRGGTVTGVVRATVSGLPVEDASVQVVDEYGWTLASTASQSDGSYEIAGLPSVSLYVIAGGAGHDWQVHDHQPCPGGPGYPGYCDLTVGSMIEFQPNTIVSGIDFDLESLGEISGTVTDAVTGLPLEGVWVTVTDASSKLTESEATDASGFYTVAGVTQGQRYVHASEDGYQNELYDDIPCSGTLGWDCYPSFGDPLTVGAGSVLNGIDFALDSLGTIHGTVTDVVTGAPLPGASVEFYEVDGYWSRSVQADGNGKYASDGLESGEYRVVASFSGYLTELYDDILCSTSSSSYCPLAQGNEVTVEVNQQTLGVDFGLQRTGGIEGAVTGPAGPIEGAVVTVYDEQGYSTAGATTDVTGAYTVTGLFPGDHYVRVRSIGGHLGELYDDIPCASSCQETSGSPVEVAAANVVSGIDFELALGGSLSGSVTDAATGSPLPYATVSVYDSQGRQVGWETADSAGDFIVDRLSPGEHFVRASKYGFIQQLYDGIDCPAGCDPITGTPVAVVSASDTPDIDFALSTRGSVSGTVRDSSTGFPLGSAQVRLYRLGDPFYSTNSAYTDSDGTYLIRNVDEGEYTVTAERNGYGKQLYEGVPCLGSCDHGLGTAISVATGAQVGGIDFGLDPGGTIEGAVTDFETGEPIANCRVNLWNEDGSFGASVHTDSSGLYSFPGVSTGDHYFSTYGCTGYLDELYDDLPCYGGAPAGCTPTKGTPVEVASGGLVRHVDFALFEMASGIAGWVVDAADGQGAVGVYIDVWDVYGQRVDTAVTRASGAYQLRLDPGTYYLSTDSGGRFVEQIWSGLACPAGPPAQGHCNPLLGDPVTVDGALTPIVGGVDFELTAPLIFEDGFESGNLSAWSTVVQ